MAVSCLMCSSRWTVARRSTVWWSIDDGKTQTWTAYIPERELLVRSKPCCTGPGAPYAPASGPSGAKLCNIEAGSLPAPVWLPVGDNAGKEYYEKHNVPPEAVVEAAMSLLLSLKVKSAQHSCPACTSVAKCLPPMSHYEGSIHGI
eukprot:362822-Chlamydomonas_euryale.AAC.11